MKFMNFSCQIICFLAVVLVCGVVNGRGKDREFDVNYVVTWGNDHVLVLKQGREVRLSMDVHSGAGFRSKLSYGSGFFRMRIKLPKKDSAGVVTAFYLTSNTNHNDELDFEFLGNKEGKPITLQTNVYVNGQGDREQRMFPWFDPTADFHTYKILWNQHHIVFYVDAIPIRVFESSTNIGVEYPSQPMQVTVSLWNGEGWATDGGQTKTNWSHAPFIAHFRGFNLDACTTTSQLTSNNTSIEKCTSNHYWWNRRKFRKLDQNQMRKYEQVREKYMYYDYCGDRGRYPNPPPECINEQLVS